MPASSNATLDSRPKLVFGDRYGVDREVKRGGSIETYFGTDRATGEPVVIKTASLRSIADGAVMRLRHEADVMRNIKSDTVSGVLEIGEHRGVLYLVMPFVSGITLEERLRQQPLTLAETLCVGSALLTALCAAHEQGVLHRDIKPANVIVNDGPIVERATLIDFGLARSAQLEAAIRNQFVGTARYMAPEQAGLLDRGVLEPSDLYSVGIVLFECLAGRPPFTGGTVGEVLRQHMTTRVPKLRGMGVDVPRVVDETIQRLVRKDPGDRYQTAAGALYDLNLILAALRRGEVEPTFVVGLHDSRNTLTEPAFVGRSQELDRLNEHALAAKQGRGGLVLVEAETGLGKTRLLEELTHRAAQDSALVVRGQFPEQVGRPLQALEGISRNLVTEGSIDPDLLTNLKQALGEHREVISGLLPALGKAMGVEVLHQAGPEAWGEARALNALTALLDSLGTAERPALVILDDCQWADELSLKLIAQWCKADRARPARGHSLVLAAFRSEQVGVDFALREMPALDSIELLPFEPEDTRKVAVSMAGSLPEDVLKLLEQLSEGSPFMISAVLRGLVETGALVPEAEGWRAEPTALENVQSSRHAAAFLARRIDQFPPETIDFLTAGAVLGKEFPLSFATKLAGQTPAAAFASVHEACQRNVIWSRGDGTRYVFVHDRLRTVLLDRLSAEQRAELHRRTAIQLEQESPEACFDLAYHFDAAGETARAMPYALQAADQARQHSLAIAAEQYEIAKKGVPEADAATNYRIALGRGDILMLQGKYNEAKQVLQAADFLAQDAAQKADIQGRMGELFHKQGDMKASGECIERALELLGRPVPKSEILLILGLAWEVLIQAMHTALPQRLVKRKQLEAAEVEFIAISLLRRLSYSYWFSRGTIRTLWAHLRGMNLAERFPDTLELAHAYANHGPVMSTIRWYSRGNRYAERSLRIRREFDDVWGQAHSMSFHGVVLYAQSRFDECIEKCREAARLFEQTGDYWELTTARYEIALSSYRLGNLQAAVEEAQKTREIGLAHNDLQASGMPLDVWSLASRGKVPEEVVELELNRGRNDPQTTAQVLLAEGVRLSSAGDQKAAAAVLEDAFRSFFEARIFHAWVAAILPWLTTARRRQAEAAVGRTPAARRRLLKLANKAAFKARVVAWVFNNELPHVFRERALLSAMHGRISKARKLFDRSLQTARRQHARYEEARTLLARGEIGREVGWSTADEDISQANHILEDILPVEKAEDTTQKPVPRPTTLSLVDRFGTALEAGREIASALTRDAVFAAVNKAAARLLRGELCLVLELADPGDLKSFSVVAGDATDLVISRKSLEQAATTRRPAVFAEGMAADASESLVLSNVRSTLCAPILFRQEVAGFVYVTHREVVGLFGENEEQLAAFIATIAGAALENAHGFAELQNLNATLEQHVAERTADLQRRTEELAKSNEELEQFAYVASHDLQEPLRTVASYCQLLQRRYSGQLDENADQFIQTAIDGAARMRTLINDLLAYSRVGTKGKEFAPTDFNQVVDRALENLKMAIIESDAIVTRDDLPVADGDDSQLIRLFQNLIGNAIKFRGDRIPRIHVTAKPLDDGWQFSVEDNGIGIAPQHCERVFRIFQRLHTREDYSGTGIGLAVCQKTVVRHGGRIWVESEPGQGSTFHFIISQSGTLGQELPSHV